MNHNQSVRVRPHTIDMYIPRYLVNTKCNGVLTEIELILCVHPLCSFYSKVEGATKLKFAPFCSP